MLRDRYRWHKSVHGRRRTNTILATEPERQLQAGTDRLLLSVDEAARVVGLGRTRFYAEVLAGRVESVKIGRARRIPLAALEAYVEMLRLEAGYGESRS